MAPANPKNWSLTSSEIRLNDLPRIDTKFYAEYDAYFK